MESLFTKKFFIGIIAFVLIICLSIFLIWTFFQDYDFIYLIAAIIFPLIMFLISSPYCLGTILTLTFIIAGLISPNYLDAPYNLTVLCFSIYLLLFKIWRYGEDLN